MERDLTVWALADVAAEGVNACVLIAVSPAVVRVQGALICLKTSSQADLQAGSVRSSVTGPLPHGLNCDIELECVPGQAIPYAI